MVAGDKLALRARAKGLRAGLDLPALSARLAARVADLPEYRAARTVLLYLATPGEVDLEGLIAGDDASRTFLVPRVAPGRRLTLHAYEPGRTPLAAGPFGIREPDPAHAPEVSPSAVDLAVVPALLLSEAGDRLGYGGGYYDRLLPRLRPDCPRVGALPDVLVVPALPRDPWDVPLDVVVTESRVLRPVRPRENLDNRPGPG